MSTNEHTSTNLIELRQYLLHAGQRDTLIDVFDRELVEAQEAVGMDVLGQFRDPQRPDYFVWFRGFPDMTARHESLTAFYDGPVWAKHREVANATMIDSDNVMLLRAVTEDDALPAHRPDQRGTRAPTGLVVVTGRLDDQVVTPHAPGNTKCQWAATRLSNRCGEGVGGSITGMKFEASRSRVPCT